MTERTAVDLPIFLKWAGGKRKLLSQFSPHFPGSFENYIEPFLGGGAVFFFIKQNFSPKACFLADVNEELINCFSVVRDSPEKLIELLKGHAKDHNKGHYYTVRGRVPNSPLARAARTIYLNKTCFNGLYRVNSKGEFNVPIGRYAKPAILDERLILRASKLLKGVNLRAMSFDKLDGLAKKGDFVYLDPPYHPVSKTASFTSYTKGAFLEAEQLKLRDLFVHLTKKGCKVMLSNSDTPFIVKIYEEARNACPQIKKPLRVQAKRMINCNGSRRGAINELLILNY